MSIIKPFPGQLEELGTDNKVKSQKFKGRICHVSFWSLRTQRTPIDSSYNHNLSANNIKLESEKSKKKKKSELNFLFAVVDDDVIAILPPWNFQHKVIFVHIYRHFFVSSHLSYYTYKKTYKNTQKKVSFLWAEKKNLIRKMFVQCMMNIKIKIVHFH